MKKETSEPSTAQKGERKGGVTKHTEATKAKISATITENAGASRQALIEVVDAAMAKDDKGRFVAKLSSEQWDNALERMASGDTMKNICDAFKVSRSTLLQRASRDPDFERDLRMAMEMGQYARVENGYDAVKGGECSTGSIERDKLVAQYTQWMAARLSRKQFGDRSIIEAQSINITLKPDQTDW
jgi:hypothetical protein